MSSLRGVAEYLGGVFFIRDSNFFHINFLSLVWSKVIKELSYIRNHAKHNKRHGLCQGLLAGYTKEVGTDLVWPRHILFVGNILYNGDLLVDILNYYSSWYY